MGSWGPFGTITEKSSVEKNSGAASKYLFDRLYVLVAEG